MLKTIRYVVTMALQELGKPTNGDEYQYLEQVCINYLSNEAPLDNNVSLKCMYGVLDGGARVVQMPPDCMRISRIAVAHGKHLWTLTLDSNLAIPQELFDCKSDEDVSVPFSSWGNSYGYQNGWWRDPQYTLGGGRNDNYYRIVNGNQIIFDHFVPEGKLIIEYFSNGSDLSGDSLIENIAYASPIMYFLMWKYCLIKGNREEKAMAAQWSYKYEQTQYNATGLLNANRMAEFIDALAQGSTFNLG